ncbi:Ribosome biogenesis protein WDR12 [Thelohanellus kitauei]|uniref:Ribosome biogenesis protein WDR12 n=1 Tax=Thelohanellus kitauei TaxID=669202 RepID=A0A0C2N341_THEKT|nr:Ribosome biogenesis protein WDR12 [Thelohanellus kitauei]
MSGQYSEFQDYVEVSLVARNQEYQMIFYRYSIRNATFSLPKSTDHLQLDAIINKILESPRKGQGNERKLQFEYFIKNNPLGQIKLAEFIDSYKIETEQKMVIEYDIKKTITKNNTMIHKDAVFGIDCHTIIVTGSYDKNIYLWDRNGNLISKTNCHSRQIKCVKLFGPDST